MYESGRDPSHPKRSETKRGNSANQLVHRHSSVLSSNSFNFISFSEFGNRTFRPSLVQTDFLNLDQTWNKSSKVLSPSVKESIWKRPIHCYKKQY